MRDLSRAHTQNTTPHLPYLFPPQPLTVECLCGRLTGYVCVNSLPRRKPSAFEQNTGYTTRSMVVGMVVGMVMGAGAGAGAGASAGMLAEAVRKY